MAPKRNNKRSPKPRKSPRQKSTPATVPDVVPERADDEDEDDSEPEGGASVAESSHAGALALSKIREVLAGLSQEDLQLLVKGTSVFCSLGVCPLYGALSSLRGTTQTLTRARARTRTHTHTHTLLEFNVIAYAAQDAATRSAHKHTMMPYCSPKATSR